MYRRWKLRGLKGPLGVVFKKYNIPIFLFSIDLKHKEVAFIWSLGTLKESAVLSND